ncbi:MAG: ABC transporter ATP-binding protein [Sphaerochaetaceae bacterium]|nr:ABC transporter ATP-binding protein [Sphaerochaetaceae bacterium]MDC7238293.1 ABC transporter ATP-binding protein [Sphaerochaetaceae bacterium]MDC7242861.1 ABC transporter ATP-binding protein [Sphaerochaetaceae bacterium]MDC7249232.1 ABC transporter ATP-binding protein [Sphaerochaetaceae bacterium]
MIKFFKEKYSLSEKGAKDFVISVAWTIFMDLSFMLPVVFSFTFIDDFLSPLMKNSTNITLNTTYYIIMGLSFLFVMFVIVYFQYNSTYTKIYEESAKNRISLAEKLRKLPLAYFGKKDISDLSSTIMEDATQIEQLFSHAVPQLYGAIITTSIMAVLLFFYNWQLAIAAFWVIPIAVFVFYLSTKFQKKTQEGLYLKKRDITDKIQESLDSAQEIKAYNREDYYNGVLNKKLDNYEHSLINGELLIGAFINLSYIFLKLGLPSVILYGAYSLINGSISPFVYFVFLVVAARIYNPVMAALDNFAALIYLKVRINRMNEMKKMPKQQGAPIFFPTHYDIEFKDVDFSYLEGIQTLDKVSFVAKQGEVTALVGPSGGGKSTVAKLAARFWDIDRGLITLGDQDISKVDPEVLLHNFSIIFQDVTLFNSSVKENIRLGKKDASDEEVERAAELAQCSEFISNLPNGYDTLIGENGEKLSGGERQRISIARAILKDAPIILMDEATASLDAENESKIQQALIQLIKNKTVIIIAHRMRTVTGADKIVVIKDGSVFEQGSPSQLIEKNGLFKMMLEKQIKN